MLSKSSPAAPAQLLDGFQPHARAPASLTVENQTETQKKQAQLDHLRALIARSEGRSQTMLAQRSGGLAWRASTPTDQSGQLRSEMLPGWRTGVAELDGALAPEGLNRAGVHEFSGAHHFETVTASAYLCALLTTLKTFAQSFAETRSGPDQILWCQTHQAAREFGQIYGPGLCAFGFDPDAVLFVQTAKNKDVLWALEEGARSGAVLAVVGEVNGLSFTHSRRLTLAAHAGKTPVLLIRPHHDQTSSAADTRWRVAARPGSPDPFAPKTPGHPHWQVALTRCRGGRTGSWNLEWNHETHRLRLAEQLCPRLVQTPAQSQTV